MTRVVERLATQVFTIPGSVDLVEFLGPADSVLRTLEKGFPDVSLILRGRSISVAGPAGAVETVTAILAELAELALSGSALDAVGVQQAVDLLKETPTSSGTTVVGSKKNVRAKTDGQAQYMDALASHDIVFAIGPAGTGKTYLAMAEAVKQLLEGNVRRIILTRPAVEAGENLGFLPGSLTDKIDPYLRPLYDALGDLLEEGALPGLLEAGAVEVAPLAYMRGRTLNDAYVIVDEAQNTTGPQMKMLLTRLGHGSKMAVTGDVTQVDLVGGKRSGLKQAEKILLGIDGIEFCYLTSRDVVRTRLVADIVDAYGQYELSTGAGDL